MGAGGRAEGAAAYSLGRQGRRCTCGAPTKRACCRQRMPAAVRRPSPPKERPAGVRTLELLKQHVGAPGGDPRIGPLRSQGPALKKKRWRP